MSQMRTIYDLINAGVQRDEFAVLSGLTETQVSKAINNLVSAGKIRAAMHRSAGRHLGRLGSEYVICSEIVRKTMRVSSVFDLGTFAQSSVL